MITWWGISEPSEAAGARVCTATKLVEWAEQKAQSTVARLQSIWLRGQAVKTSPFHGGNTSSILVGVISIKYGDIAKW